jgi:phosphoribosylanthranilate isomerase
MSVVVKICGVNDAAAFDAAVEAGADMVGFVFYPPSPRAVEPAGAAALSARRSGGPLRVGLFVDATDADIARVLAALPLDLLQLHGAEEPARCRVLRTQFGLPVMKAVGVAGPADLDALMAYAPVVDRFLLDARPPPDATLPGGNAASFDWALTAGRAIPRPWLLAGGLTAANLGDALARSAAPGVDVSSGVESARGRKDPALIRAFVAAARQQPGGAAPGAIPHGAILP